MKKPLLALFLSICMTLSVPVLAHAGLLWSPELGKWLNIKDSVQDTPEAQFFVGKKLFDEGEYKRAVGEFDLTIKHYPNTPWAAEAQFHKGVAFEKLDDVGKAVEAYRTLVDRYPYSERFNDAVQREFEIAQAMLEGKKTKVWGMTIMPAVDTAAETFHHIVTASPFGPYGAAAQYHAAEAELALGNFDEAQKSYQAVVDDYPNSEYAPKAKYKIAQVSYKVVVKQQNLDVKTDEALNQYEGFKRSYPESTLVPEADSAIQQLRNKKASDLYNTALFYQERGKLASAKLYYQDVLDDFGDTPTAEMARKQLDAVTQAEAEGKKPGGIGKLLSLGKKTEPANWKENSNTPESEKKKFMGLF